MKLIFSMALLILPIIINANPIKRENLSPTVEEPLMPGTKVPIHELNTSPAPTPVENHSDKFRGTLKGTPEEQQEYKNKSKKDKK